MVVLSLKIHKVIYNNIEKLRNYKYVDEDRQGIFPGMIVVEINNHFVEFFYGSCQFVGIMIFEESQFMVDLSNLRCGCRHWKLRGIICKHAITVRVVSGWLQNHLLYS